MNDSGIDFDESDFGARDNGARYVADGSDDGPVDSLRERRARNTQSKQQQYKDLT